MILHPGQKEVAKDKHRFRVCCNGRRWGKTSLAAVEMIGYAIAYNDIRVPYYAPTRDDARDIMWQILIREAHNAIIDKNESRLELKIRNKFGGISLIALYGWEAVQDRKKGIGLANKFIVLDEVAKYRNFWLNWQEVLRPTLTDLRGEAMFISTPNGFNHFYDLYSQEITDKDFKSFHFTSYDNPHIPADEIDAAQRQMTPERFAQEFLAEFTKTSGLVFKEFSRERHIYDTLPAGKYDYIAGIDFGYSNPAAVIHIYTNGEKYYIDNEFYKTQRTETQVAEYVAGCKFQGVYPDPENPSGIEEMRSRSVNVREVSKGKGTIESGINKIHELLLNEKLLINRRCLNTIYEFESYSSADENFDRNNPEKPIPYNNHAIDAIRYAVMMTWGIRAIQPRDIIRVNQIKNERRNRFI